MRITFNGFPYKPDFFFLAAIFLASLTGFLYIEDESSSRYHTFFLGFTAIVLILALRYHVKYSLRRISRWSSNAELLSIKQLPRTAFIEKSLVKQLLRFRRQIRKSNLNANKFLQYRLKEAAENEKELFLREMRRALSTPLISLKTSIYLMQDEASKQASINHYKDILNLMEESVSQLETLSTNEIFPQPLAPKPLIKKAITLQQKMALEQGVKMQISLPENIPPLPLDPLRFQQILVGTLYHSISFVPAGKNISINGAVIKTAEGPLLEITIKDNGLGLNTIQRKHLRDLTQKHYGEKFMLPDMTIIEISVIEHLIKMHNGNFSMTANYLNGTEFKITIPYL